MPGYFRVPVVAAAPRGIVLSGGLGYGFTEARAAAPGAHHRTQGYLDADLTPLPGLDVSLSTQLRHDTHGDDAWGADSGTVLDSDWNVAWGHRLDSRLHLGGGLGAHFIRGESVGASLANPALQARLLLAYLPEPGPASVGLALGYRHDRTRGAVDELERYRPGDRLALGVSEFDAILAGIGGSYRWGATELLAELSSDLLVGTGAPGLAMSPLRASAGARQDMGDRLTLRVLADASLSRRAADDLAAFVPTEPRFQLLVGLAYQLFDWESVAPAGALPTRAEEPAAAASSLHVNVTTLEGHPLTDARVEIVTATAELPVPHRYRESYELDRVPPQSATLRVRAARLETFSRSIRLEPGVPLRIDVQLKPALQTGQMRGLVRSFGGRALRASVRVEPLGARLETDEAGTFLLDVPPGRYHVVIEAPGHASQRRTIDVARDGVVILNADLLRGQP